LLEYVIDGIKVKIKRETNLNTRSVLDCLLDLFLKQEQAESEPLSEEQER
jgi:hypothetical protein